MKLSCQLLVKNGEDVINILKSFCLIFLYLLIVPTISLATNFSVVCSKFKPGQRLSDNFVLKYLGSDPSVPMPGYHKWFVNEIPIFPGVQAIILIIRVESGVGQGKTLYSFSEQGEIISSLNLHANKNADVGPNLGISYRKLEGPFFEIRRQMYDFFENTLHELLINTYRVNKNGKFIIVQNKEHNDIRIFPEISLYQFTEKALIDFSSSDLRLMRNEIFASHGYIFKSKGLKKYFKNKTWYISKQRDVSDLLSDMEKDNLKKIKIVESKK